MKIKRVDYDDDEDPAVITVAMTIDEAAFIVATLGKMTSDQSDAVMQGGGALGSDIYATLANMFNHWDDGYDEYLEGRTA